MDAAVPCHGKLAQHPFSGNMNTCPEWKADTLSKDSQQEQPGAMSILCTNNTCKRGLLGGITCLICTPMRPIVSRFSDMSSHLAVVLSHTCLFGHALSALSPGLTIQETGHVCIATGKMSRTSLTAQ